jgi:type IV pili sensor histidine kinase/response regulator
MKNGVLTSIAFGIAILSASVYAEQVATDRYTLITPTPETKEIDPLSVNIQLSFPPSVKTVRDAVNFVLMNSGWVLALDKSNDEALGITLERPLPQVHRKLSLMPLRTVLQVLVGQYYVPVEDPLRRIYTFDLKDEYKGLVNHD